MTVYQAMLLWISIQFFGVKCFYFVFVLFCFFPPLLTACLISQFQTPIPKVRPSDSAQTWHHMWCEWQDCGTAFLLALCSTFLWEGRIFVKQFALFPFHVGNNNNKDILRSPLFCQEPERNKGFSHSWAHSCTHFCFPPLYPDPVIAQKVHVKAPKDGNTMGLYLNSFYH